MGKSKKKSVLSKRGREMKNMRAVQRGLTKKKNLADIEAKERAVHYDAKRAKKRDFSMAMALRTINTGILRSLRRIKPVGNAMDVACRLYRRGEIIKNRKF